MYGIQKSRCQKRNYQLKNEINKKLKQTVYLDFF